MMAKTTQLPRRKQTQPTITSLHLPFDLVVEIFYRLPVKHLIRLCCVCKSWSSLISRDSDFANKHLRLSTCRLDRHHVILSSPEFVLYHSPISSIFSSAHTTMFRYSLEFLNKSKCGDRASTCDGIVCFQLNNSSAMLCNPSIRKFKILPPLIFQDQIFDQILYTLVYDRFTNNYKIIALNTNNRKKEVNVHTLGTDYWRRIQDYPGPHLIVRSRPGTFVNDSVNWLTHSHYDRHSQYVFSLDLEKESYQKLSVPVFDADFSISYITTLGTLRGCLSLFYHRDKYCDVWIMKEYGNEKSWTKLLTVPPMRCCHNYCYTGALYSKDDQVLMEFMKNGHFSLVVYDSINNTFKIPKFQNYGMTPEVYVESLISPL